MTRLVPEDINLDYFFQRNDQTKVIGKPLHVPWGDDQRIRHLLTLIEILAEAKENDPRLQELGIELVSHLNIRSEINTYKSDSNLDIRYDHPLPS
jgi:hypothetical protein